MLTRCAARDLSGVIVVSVSPGWIRTDMGGAAAELDPREATAALADTIDLGGPRRMRGEAVTATSGASAEILIHSHIQMPTTRP